MAEDYFDLSNFSEDDWRDMETPITIPSGWYRALVKEVDTDKDTGNLLLFFQIRSGAYAGKKVRETLWNPENSDSAEKSAVSTKRRLLFASRLGLVTAADKARRDPHFRIVWDNAIGVEVWIKVDLQTYEKKDKQGRPTGEKGTSNRITFDGIYPVNDDRVPEEVRKGTHTVQVPAGAGAGNGGGGGGKPGTGGKKPDLSDLM